MGKTYVNVCIDKASHRHIDKPLEDCTIAIVNGKDYKLSDLINDFNALTDKVVTLTNEHNILVTKYNALLAAYKSNAAKTAMQLLDIEEK